MKNPLGIALLFSISQLSGCIGLPEIIEEETIKNTKKNGRKLVKSIEESYEEIAILFGYRDDYKVPSDAEFETCARNRLEELNDLIRRVPFTLDHAKSALRRVNEESAPNGPNNQQFKDSAIWEAVLELAQSHTIHFITADKAFFAGRDPSRGLARNLQADCASTGAIVHAYEDLPSYLRTLKENIPSLNYKELAAIIEQEVSDELDTFGAAKDFAILKLKDHSISAFLTETKDILALSFELIFDVVDTSEFREAAPIIDFLAVKGDCSYDYSSQKLSNIRMTSMEYRAASGQLIGSKSRSTIFLESMTMGGGQVPYTFRKPL